jgi:hypothetical protein
MRKIIKEGKKMRFQRTGFQKAIGLVLMLVMAFSLIPTMEAHAGIFDDMATAVGFEYGTNVSQTIESSDDADWFYFETNDYAEFYTIHVSNQTEEVSAYHYYNELGYCIYDADGNCLYDIHSYGRKESGTKYYKFSTNATYYIKFYNYEYFQSPYEYVFNVSCEKEDADNADNAKKISFNKVYAGNIVTSGDEDWFKIVTPKYAMSYSMQVANQTEEVSAYHYYNELGYRIYDDEKNCLYDIHSYGRLENGTKDLLLSAGKTYYVQFYNYSYFNSLYEYTFKLIANDIDFLGAPQISKVSAVSKGFKVTWNKGIDATGYQIRYSTKKNMKNAKTVTVSSTGKKITKLKAKTKYYVQVRAYAKLSTGKKLYSKWSVKKTVTTKK